MDRFEEKHYITIALIMGLMGSFFWAIRGTVGFGGSQGGLLAGLGWAILWYYFATLDDPKAGRPYVQPRIIAAITFGIAFGGMTGYGVYIAWLQGKFYLDYPEGMRAIAPFTGYAMLFICGIHWGGVTGAFMAWCAPKYPLTLLQWTLRIGAGVAGALGALFIVKTFPQWFLPFYNEGVYDIAENRTCVRAANSIQTIAPHVGLFFGFLLFELCRRDWRAVGMMAVMALGFAVPFAIGGYWHTFHGAPLKIDWWKNWEMTIGLGGGLAFGLAFYLFNQPQPHTGVHHTPIAEWVWGVAFPLWLWTCLIVSNAYEGFVQIHGFSWPSNVRVVVGIAYAIPAVFVLIWWLHRLTKENADRAAPPWMLALAIGIIIVAGYMVSLPVPIPFNSLVLIVLYTIYLGVSAMLWLSIIRE